MPLPYLGINNKKITKNYNKIAKKITIISKKEKKEKEEKKKNKKKQRKKCTKNK
jgi:hypothetical protein